GEPSVRDRGCPSDRGKSRKGSPPRHEGRCGQRGSRQGRCGEGRGGVSSTSQPLSKPGSSGLFPFCVALQRSISDAYSSSSRQRKGPGGTFRLFAGLVLVLD